MRNTIRSIKKQKVPSGVKIAINKLLFYYRYATWRIRPLPDLIIIGAQKSGTTSLHVYLSQHPQFLKPYEKEVHFFDGGLDPAVDNYNKGQAWYRAHFPFRKNRAKVFEASPLYIFNPIVPKRMFNLIPEVKIVAILRNPTERAISHYFHEKQRGYESLPIMEALLEEERRMESAIQRKDYKNYSFIHHSYKSRGHYGEQLERFFEFFPRHQALILTSEEFFSGQNNILRQVTDFTGTDSSFNVRDSRPRNVARNKEQVAHEIYEYLNNYFRPHNEALYELLGKEYNW
jgi:Sulfotransferase domain